MHELSWDSPQNTDRTSRPDERPPSDQVGSSWRRSVTDTLLALAGVALATGIIEGAQLYPRLPSVMLTYLIMVIVLAGTRGSYAAILSALLASLSVDFFLTPPLYQFSFTNLEADDLLDTWVFLIMAIIAGQLAAILRRRAEQARHRERETLLLSQQAQALATLQERQRLARELHDSVAQALYGISLGAHTAREALESDPGEVIAPLEYVIDLAEAGLAEMRTLIFELRPESLAAEGLIGALTKQVTVLRTRYKLAVDTQLSEEPPLSLESKQVLYRIAQEALHNIIKHAHARTVFLSLSRQDGELILEVCDDGKGFDPTEAFPGHMGLRSIQERVALLGGSYSLESTPAQGTCLRVRIPLQEENELAGQ
ncbi:MAG TPA: sensor histidine kinase [Ktedonobacteraceae bacterium]|nr:sensor histidine kinase [Ktedonobacteraceae bacterium]